MSDELLHERSLFGLVEFTVVIIKEVDLAQAQDLCRFLQLAFADFPQFRWPWILFRGPEPALLAPSSRYQVRFNVFGRVLGEDTSYSQRFVIRVRDNTDQSEVTRRSAAQTWPIRWTSTVPSNHSGSAARNDRSVSYQRFWSG